VDLPLSGKLAVTQVHRKTHDVSHRSSKDLRVHSRNLEGIPLPSRIECVDGVLQVMVCHTRFLRPKPDAHRMYA
jgi:hypothetical protein